MGGRAVEGTGLENRQGGDSFVGSNPTPSAIDIIHMKPPFFWYKTIPWFFAPFVVPFSILILKPISWVYALIASLKNFYITPTKINVPVICVGNCVLGGSGKTPVVLSLIPILKSMNFNCHVLSRGYKGTLTNIGVNPSIYNPFEVGDEPWIISRHAPTWIGSNRVRMAHKAMKAGANLIIMDDGFQNSYLHKNCSLLVVNGDQQFGNGKLFPHGPLRESIQSAIEKSHAIIWIGKKNINFKTNKPIVYATIEPAPVLIKKGSSIVAFCGLGYPLKFKNTLIEMGYDVAHFYEFEDHHCYKNDDLHAIINHQLPIVTTEKDWVKLSPEIQSKVIPIFITLKYENLSILQQVIQSTCIPPSF
jgi:tetraacyldisaccharide 4'-kinase